MKKSGGYDVQKMSSEIMTDSIKDATGNVEAVINDVQNNVPSPQEMQSIPAENEATLPITDEIIQHSDVNSEQGAENADGTQNSEEKSDEQRLDGKKGWGSFLKGNKSDARKFRRDQKRSQKHGDGVLAPIITKPVTKAVIPAAGFGTRFLPATKAIPKEMLPIVNIPSIQHVVQECVESGITDILIVLGRGKNSIENHFDKSVELENELRHAKKSEYLKMVQKISKMANITYIRQKEMMGSGWAVHYAKTFAGDDPIAVLFGDDVMFTSPDQKPVTAQLIEAYKKTGKSVLGVQQIQGEEIRKYGVVIPGWKDGRFSEVLGILEKPDKDVELPSRLTSLGRFLLTPDIFKILEHTPKGKGNEIFLTDAMTIQAKSGGVVAYEFEGRRYDIGDREGFLEAQVEFGLRDPELHDKFLNYIKRVAPEAEKFKPIPEKCKNNEEK